MHAKGERAVVEKYIEHTLTVLEADNAPEQLRAHASRSRETLQRTYPRAYAAAKISVDATALLERLLKGEANADLFRGVDMARIAAMEAQLQSRIDQAKTVTKLKAIGRLIRRRRTILGRSARGRIPKE